MDWIPYDGKHSVPNDKEEVLITCRWDDGTYSVHLHDYWQIANSKNERGFGLWDRVVIAWMPMPEPYIYVKYENKI